MTKRIFRSVFLCAMAVLLASLVIIMGVLYSYFTGIAEAQLHSSLLLAAEGVEDGGTGYLSGLDGSSQRLTWIAADGSVIYDTQVADEMENHLEREEVRSALETGFGESVRYSTTLTERNIYYAMLLSDGSVLRISVSQLSVLSLLIGMLQSIVIVAILAAVISGLLAAALAKRIVGPLNELDLDDPMSNNAYDELAPLLTQIDRQHKKIDAQLKELKRSRDEFNQITSNMREGLVLLGRDDTIISINPAAQTLFDTDESCVGRGFLTLERSADVSRAIRSARENGSGGLQLVRSDRIFRIDVSRTDEDGAASGLVLLAFDMTDQYMAEQSRREFTANVSHELKTPLQTILGSAELLENGLVKQEDVPRFLAHIRAEASRLVSLISDIIRLSQLDEGSEMAFEPVELRELARSEAALLEPVAAERGITIHVEGGPLPVPGVRQLFHEIVGNLLDNAIKYNREGGSVTLTLSESGGRALLSVADTGIGIPYKDQSRVFERFYRVDKSRSKKGGGTGLGLSIVKHAVQYLGGSITLQSIPGEGTEITVSLPMSARSTPAAELEPPADAD